MRLKDLESALTEVDPFDNPKSKCDLLEPKQYRTFHHLSLFVHSTFGADTYIGTHCFKDDIHSQ